MSRLQHIPEAPSPVGPFRQMAQSDAWVLRAGQVSGADRIIGAARP